MSKVFDRYIYLTENHYVLSGDYNNDLSYMNSLHNELIQKIENKLNANKRYEFALNNLYSKFKSSNLTNTTLQSIRNKKASDIERDIDKILQLIGPGGKLPTIVNTINDLLNSKPSAAQIQSIINKIITFNKEAKSTLGNIQGSAASYTNTIDNFINTFYLSNNPSIMSILNTFNQYLQQDLTSLAAQLKSAYVDLLKEQALALTSYQALDMFTSNLQKMGIKIFKRPARPRPKAINNQQVTYQDNSIKVKLPQYKVSEINITNPTLPKQIIKSFFNYDEYSQPEFDSHYTNLISYHIKGGPRLPNTTLKPLGERIANDTSKLLGLLTLLNITDFIYENNKKIHLYNINELLHKTTIKNAPGAPFDKAITLNDTRFFGRGRAPQQRVDYILSKLHEQKLRIALGS